MVENITASVDCLKTTGEVYDFVGRTLAAKIPKSVVIVTQLDEKLNKAYVYGFYGLQMPWFNKLISVLGLNPVGKHYDLSREIVEQMQGDCEFRRFNGSLYQFSEGQISEWMGKSIELLFSIKAVYFAALSFSKMPIGSVLVFTRTNDTPCLKEAKVLVETASERLYRIILRNFKELNIPIVKDEFTHYLLGNLSHEIRTPLNGILGALEFAKDDDGTHDAINVGLIDEVWNNARDLTKNIESLVLASELATHSAALNKKVVKVGEVIDWVREIVLELSLKHNGRDIDFRVGGVAQENIFVDKGKLLYMAEELICNALKFSADRVVVTCNVLDRLKLSVEDLGIGLSEEEQMVIFEHFGRVNHAGRVFRGMGLGLFNCSQLAELHNGTLKLVSQPMAGTVVTLEIPFSATANGYIYEQ